MNKTLIIVRHAKAKRPVEGQPDLERDLSEAGERAFRATLPQALGLWRDGWKHAEVWCSPAARTRQTADLVRKALKARGAKPADGVRECDFLWTGNLPMLAEELCAAEAGTVVVVGHNPYAQDWTRYLTGSSIVFATGGMVAIELDVDALAASIAAGTVAASAGEAPIGRLLWFAQGPVSQRWKTLVSLEGTFAEAADAAQEWLQQFFDDPEDIETMHKFRVSLRTLRSLVAFAKPWQDARQNAQVQADLRTVVGVTSRLRELDVLAEQADARTGRSDELVAFCKQLARDERARVSDSLSDKRMRKRLKRACDELHRISWKRALAEQGLEAAAVRAHFDDMADALSADLQALDFAEVERTHDVRKRAKRVRYCAERFKDILGDDAPAIAKSMTAHQDDLGAICDARVNIDIINGLAPEDLPEPVAWDLALLRAENETFLYTTLRGSR